jgi:hypothetical protein
MRIWRFGSSGSGRPGSSEGAPRKSGGGARFSPGLAAGAAGLLAALGVTGYALKKPESFGGVFSQLLSSLKNWEAVPGEGLSEGLNEVPGDGPGDGPRAVTEGSLEDSGLTAQGEYHEEREDIRHDGELVADHGESLAGEEGVNAVRADAKTAREAKRETSRHGSETYSAAEFGHGGKSPARLGDARARLSEGPDTRLPRFVSRSPRLRLGVDSQGSCASVEFPGYSPAVDGWDEKEWKNIVTLFEETRKRLEDWVKKESSLAPRSREVMAARLALLKIEKPSQSEPDLFWRGIPVWSLDDSEAPRVRVGLGFGELLRRQPERARFELARALAQSWAPCELLRLNAPLVAEKELGCLGVKAQESCVDGTYSEAGWATATWVAAQASPPGCRIPALIAPGVSECLGRLKEADSGNRQVASVLEAQSSQAGKGLGGSHPGEGH